MQHSHSHTLILIPPSEGKAPGGSRTRWKPNSGLFGSSLAESRRSIARALIDYDGGSSELLGVSGPHLTRSRDANRSLIGAPTMPAWQRYTGVVWEHLDAKSLSTTSMRRAEASVVVLSAVLGLVGFTDPIPDYKLKMSASLDLPNGSRNSDTHCLQKLSTFWKPLLSPLLDEFAKNKTVIDLLPNEHRRAWEPCDPSSVLRVSFVDRNGRTTGHGAKAAKGLFVRHLLSSRSRLEPSIESWSHPDFRLHIS